jgi:hypothetical protein
LLMADEPKWYLAACTESALCAHEEGPVLRVSHPPEAGPFLFLTSHKRHSIMKDATATMGTILPDDASGRDAVHVAVVAVTASRTLVPGAHVGFSSMSSPDNLTVTSLLVKDKCIGIVDPYLTEPVKKGQKFWLYLYPRTITSLHHQWKHPAFDDDAGSKYTPPARVIESMEWIRNYCRTGDGPSYEILMDAIAKLAKEGNTSWNDEYLHIDGTDAHGEISPELWEHAENVLGYPIPWDKPKYFSCAC